MLVKPAVDRGDRFLERLLQELLVIRVMVMIRYRSGRMLARPVPNMLQPAMQQGQHVLGTRRVEEPVIVSCSDVNWARVGHNPAPPTVVMWHGAVARPP